MSDLVKILNRDRPWREEERLLEMLFPGESGHIPDSVRIECIQDRSDPWHPSFVGLCLRYRDEADRTVSRFVRVKDGQIDLDEVRRKHQELSAGALKADAAEKARETERRRALTKLWGLIARVQVHSGDRLELGSKPDLYNLTLHNLEEEQVRLVLQVLGGG